MKKRYKLKLRPLSPIHIGTGDQISPLEYLIKDSGGDLPTFHRFSLDKFMNRLIKESPKIAAIIGNESDLNRVRKLIYEHIDLGKDSLYSCVCGWNIFDEYENKINDDNNQLLIDTMIRNPKTGAPYLPGSTIKGAIRTALISSIAQGQSLSNRGNPEWGLLGMMNPLSDPFRAIHISDSNFLSNNSWLLDVRNYSKKKQECTGIQMWKEQTDCINWNPDVEAIGTLTIDHDIQNQPSQHKWDKLPHKFDVKMITEKCTSFYKPKMESEYTTFYKNTGFGDIYPSLLERVNSFSSSTFLLRIGQFSHFECMTLDNLRKSPKKGYGSSRGLSDEQYPMGWIEVSLEEL